ncbi:MAG: LamG domain-containing protein [Phycisphaerae bacterium]|nr:LamG domain-containing protein [Phycisphaerae bacterium]
MKPSFNVTTLVSAWAAILAAAQPTIQLRQPWEFPYGGDDAIGRHVIALWQFAPGAETEDASGHGHTLRLAGTKIHPDGRFGSGLESFRGYPVEDKQHAAVAKNNPLLTPKGAFTLEMWIKPKPELNGYGQAFLLDKKYVSHADYQLILTEAGKSGERVLRACLGFGAYSDDYHSSSLRIEPNAWYHVAFTYDGAGTGAFYVNGIPKGGASRASRKNIAPGTHPLSIGDRIGSYHHGFPGFIDQVRITEGTLEFRRASVSLHGDRSTFVRMEKAPPLRLVVTNHDRQPLDNAKVKLLLDGATPKTTNLPKIDSGKTHTVEYTLDTALRPDTYTLSARLTLPAPNSGKGAESFRLKIVPRQPPHRYPVLMWGVYSPRGVVKEIDRLKQIGFTHVLGLGADYGTIWKDGKPTLPGAPEDVESTRQMLDLALANDITIVASLSPGHYLRDSDRFLRINRNGKPYDREDICGLFPEIPPFCENVGASVAQAYSGYPAFQAALIHTEVRDGAQLCFHDHDRAAYRKCTGLDIPPAATGKWGIRHADHKDLPPSRVIPDDHPIYRYYQWFWKEGDGWPALNSAVAKGLKSTGRSDFWTFNDPAVRVASVYGSGGRVDVLSQWTYSYPDPIRIGIATDELLAMAAGASPQQGVMKMTQVIWYRRQTAPKPSAVSRPASRQASEVPPLDTLAQQPGAIAASGVRQAPWEIQQPDAPFITIAPMHLREAFWTKIARPIRGIMYHGWQSLVPCEDSRSYCYTNPQTQHELARLIDTVVKPLGPTLLQVPGIKGDVAFLESFASQMFAGRGTYGWGRGWGGDAYLIMLYAHLQPEIVYDETIVQRGLDDFRVLVMCDCDVITQAMAERIKAFQQKGGLVVADERLASAIKPDILMRSYERIGKAGQDKAALVERALAFRKQLDARYMRQVDTSDPDVIPYRRRYKGVDYLFLVNDRREFGQYVGQHGLVMENGLPTSTTVAIRRKAGYVYDLVDGGLLATVPKEDKIEVNVTLGPCDGAMWMVTPSPIAAVRVTAPQEVRQGGKVLCRVEVIDERGVPLEAVVPVEVCVRDSEGRAVEFSGYYGAAGGGLDIPLTIAPNDAPGMWQIEAVERASGQRATHYFRVAPSLQ